MKLTDLNGVFLLQANNLNSFNVLAHGFGVRGIKTSDYLDKLNIKDRFIVETDQIHGNTVHCLLYPKKDIKLSGDAFITSRPGMVCFVRTADCVPVLIYDSKNKAVAAIHAGWKGTAQNIIAETLKAMKSVYNTNPSDCFAAIGPHICEKCFEVGEDVVLKINELGSGERWFYDSNHINLGLINYDLLKLAGVKDINIEKTDICTKCDSCFASWRRDKDANERQFNFILLR